LFTEEKQNREQVLLMRQEFLKKNREQVLATRIEISPAVCHGLKTNNHEVIEHILSVSVRKTGDLETTTKFGFNLVRGENKKILFFFFETPKNSFHNSTNKEHPFPNISTHRTSSGILTIGLLAEILTQKVNIYLKA
jgi:hypothetical protein